MRIVCALFCLTLVGGGCASVRQTADPMLSAEPLREGEISLRIQALPQSRDVPHWISTKEMLLTNDRFSVHVKTGQPLFLYVLSVPKMGAASVLYSPAEGALPQAELRMPQEGGYYTLGSQTGRERIQLIGARSRLSAEQLSSYSQTREGDKEREPDEKVKEEPPPKIPDEGERNPRIVRAVLNKDGIGVVHFDFTHR